MGKDYYNDRAKANLKSLYAILKDLPPYVQDFFVGLESRTAPLTRLNYAYDLRIFYQFIVKKIYTDKEVKNITLEDLDAIDAFAFEQFLTYLNEYEFKGKINCCNEQAKKRKLASIRTFYKYFYNKDLLITIILERLVLKLLKDLNIN